MLLVPPIMGSPPHFPLGTQTCVQCSQRVRPQNPTPLSSRNLRRGPSGLADEINFEDFLTIMSYFRPIDTSMDEEQVELCRKEKLRCTWSPPCARPAGPWSSHLG